jgi:hypothetical protein
VSLLIALHIYLSKTAAIPYSKAFSITRCSYAVVKFRLFKEILEVAVGSLCVLLGGGVFVQLAEMAKDAAEFS